MYVVVCKVRSPSQRIRADVTYLHTCVERAVPCQIRMDVFSAARRYVICIMKLDTMLIDWQPLNHEGNDHMCPAEVHECSRVSAIPFHQPISFDLQIIPTAM
jgi:hypothetical protein